MIYSSLCFLLFCDIPFRILLSRNVLIYILYNAWYIIILRTAKFLRCYNIINIFNSYVGCGQNRPDQLAGVLVRIVAIDKDIGLLLAVQGEWAGFGGVHDHKNKGTRKLLSSSMHFLDTLCIVCILRGFGNSRNTRN